MIEKISSHLRENRRKYFMLSLKVVAGLFLAYQILSLDRELNVAGCRVAVSQAFESGGVSP